MREPFLDELELPEKGIQKRAAKSRAKAGKVTRTGKGATGENKVSGKRKLPRAHLPRVPGGKALARLHFFEQQRQIEETDVKRKNPDKPSWKLLRGKKRSPSVRSSPGSTGATGSTSPYLLAFAQKTHLDSIAPARAFQHSSWTNIR